MVPDLMCYGVSNSCSTLVPNPFFTGEPNGRHVRSRAYAAFSSLLDLARPPHASTPPPPAMSSLDPPGPLVPPIRANRRKTSGGIGSCEREQGQQRQDLGRGVCVQASRGGRRKRGRSLRVFGRYSISCRDDDFSWLSGNISKFT